MQLKSLSKHRPVGMIIDVDEKDAKELLKEGEFVEKTEEVLTFVKKEKEVKQELEK